MPDAFFQSQKNKKRKRSASSDQRPSSSKKPARAASKQSARGGKKTAQTPARAKRHAADEELSDGTQNEDEGVGVDDMDLRAPDVDPNAYESGEEDEDETEAEKRLRLAQLYIQGVKESLSLADGEFDAAEIDREIISARLKQDVLEHSGKVYLFVADSFDLANPPTLRARGHKFSVTCAVASEDTRWLYTAGKDGYIIKWDLQSGRKAHTFYKVRSAKEKGKGKAKDAAPQEVEGHTDEVWQLAVSPDGRLLASGGKDRRVGVWDVEKDVWLKGFRNHRNSVSALAFRKASTKSSGPSATEPLQLYTGSFDRNINVYDLSVMGYVETLFGHDSPVLSIDALMRETAVSAGGRDKSARFWKVQEESHLVLRGGGRSKWEDALDGADLDEMVVDGPAKQKRKNAEFIEGSVECVAMVDETTFVSGGDSGTISLWTTTRKKAVFRQSLAHGFDESHADTEDVDVVRKPRWITAIGCLRYSDLFASGSWDGEIRLWKLDDKLKSFALVGTIPVLGVVNSIQFVTCPRGTSSALAWAHPPAKADDGAAVVNGVNGAAKPKAQKGQAEAQTVLLVAGVGSETRLGRWVQRKGEGHLNGALVVALHPRTTT